MVTSTWETLREKLYVVTPTWEAEAKKSKLDRKDQSSLSPNQTRSTGYKEGKKVPRREKVTTFFLVLCLRDFQQLVRSRRPFSSIIIFLFPREISPGVHKLNLNI